jgi:hypothetical protein
MTVTLENDDRPPNTQVDSVDTFAREVAARSEADVLEGLRELEGAEGVKWFIYRINAPDPTQNGFLDRWGTALLTQENLRDKFGPGSYKVRGHYPNGTYAAHRTIEIAGDAPRREVGKDTKTVTASGPMDLPQLLVMLDARDERRRAEEAAKRDENQSFWKSLAATLAPIVAPKLIDLMTGNTGKQGTVTELLTGLKELRSLDGPTKSGVGGLKETLEMVALMRDTFDGGSRVGEKGPWDALTELARAAGPKVGAVLEALPQALNVGKSNLPTTATAAMRVISSSPPNSARVASPNLSPVPVTASLSVSGAPDGFPTAPSTNSGENTTNPEVIRSETSETNPTPASGDGAAHGTSGSEDMNLGYVALIPYMRKQLELLVLKAHRNSDPSLYAELMLDNLPEGVQPQTILDFLQRDDWWHMLNQFDERVQPYGGWFENLRTELITLINDK